MVCFILTKDADRLNFLAAVMTSYDAMETPHTTVAQ